MCNLDIHIVLKDRDFNKVIEYNSISTDGFVFTIDAAKSLLDQLKGLARRRNYKLLTDDDYENLKAHPRGGDFLEHDSLDDLPVREQDLLAKAALPDVNDLYIAANQAISEVEKAHSAPTERIEQGHANFIDDMEANELSADKFDADEMYAGPAYKRPLVRESQLTLNKFVGMFSKSHDIKLQDLQKINENEEDDNDSSENDRLSPLARYDTKYNFNYQYF